MAKRPTSAIKKGQSRIGEKVQTKAELCNFLTMVREATIDTLQKATPPVLVKSDKGRLLMLTDGIAERFEVAEDAEMEHQAQFMMAIFVETLITRKNKPDFFNTAMGYVVGIGSGALLLLPELKETHDQVMRLTAHRKKGGLASRRLKGEQVELALRYVNAELGPYVKLSAACTRAAAKLRKEHSIKVSGKTLSRLFPSRVQDNAASCPE